MSPTLQAAVLTLIGVILEGIGVGLALWGLHRTFRELAGESEFEPLWGFGRRVRLRSRQLAAAVAAKLGRRPASRHMVGGSLSLSLSGSVRTRGRAGFGEVHDWWRPWKAIPELDQRTRDLANRVADVRDKAEDEVERLDKDIAELRTELRAEAGRIEQFTKRVGTIDVRHQMAGLALVVAGIAFQAWAVLILLQTA